ncbi:Phenylacetate-coenzyme A ligase [Rhodococcus wratislaviensis]|uniref:Phenylacetate-coenzyme A ligase n=2 Tax=Rhodococcus wratislaviensis TaxID=44752 RepID=A0A402CL22_RHOWR|nr:Phenylacetate-coenzyme A ligase [Rhodococcus wratislaviensis]
MNMIESQYWNPKTETLPREQLRALQFVKLQNMVAWAEARSPYYRRSFAEAGFSIDQLRTWDDYQRIPFLTRDQWMHSQNSVPPYGELPVVGHEGAIRIHTTSGTSGRTPLRALDSRKDWFWSAEMWCYALWGQGVRSSDIAYMAFGYGSFIGFWGLHNGLEKMGALVVPGGAQSTTQRVKQIVDFDCTVVATTPTYAFRMAQEARALGIDLPASKVRTLVLSGEPAGMIPETKALIEAEWGAKAYDTAGMTEISTIFMFEPKDQPGGCHIIEDHLYEQVVDSDTLEELPYGERGERVTTSFGRSAIPLIKYRTGDAVVKVPHTSTTNGRTFDLYEGGILGRVDDMKLVRGTNMYPRAVEGIVRGYAVEEFQIRIEKVGIRDEIFLTVEPHVGIADHEWSAMEAQLGNELAEAHEGLRFIIQRAETDSLPRFELKAKRLQDLR